MLEVEVPPGCSPGDTMSVLLPSGAMLDVIVPDGCESGSTITVERDAEKLFRCGGGSHRVRRYRRWATHSACSLQAASSLTSRVPMACGQAKRWMLRCRPLLLPARQHRQQLAEPPSPPKSPREEESSPTPEQPAPKRIPAQPDWEQAVGAYANLAAAAEQTAAALANARGLLSRSAGDGLTSSPTRFGGSRFSDRFSPARTQQHFNSSSPADRFKERKAAEEQASTEYLTCRSDMLREPKPDPGCRLCRPACAMLRSSGEWSEGTVLELLMPGLLETMYRCRLGEGVLEKMVGEDEVRWPAPDPGFTTGGRLCRSSGRMACSNWARLRTSKIDSTGSGAPPEPWYSVRIHPSEISPSPPKEGETLHEEDLQLPVPQAGCGFYVGQLVHAQRKDGTTVLCRVREFERVGYSLGYKCEVVRLG